MLLRTMSFLSLGESQKEAKQPNQNRKKKRGNLTLDAKDKADSVMKLKKKKKRTPSKLHQRSSENKFQVAVICTEHF